MAERSDDDRKPDRDEPVVIPLDPETALRGLLAVDPESESVAEDGCPAQQARERDRG